MLHLRTQRQQILQARNYNQGVVVRIVVLVTVRLVVRACRSRLDTAGRKDGSMHPLAEAGRMII
jgi:hypothetical protein